MTDSGWQVEWVRALGNERGRAVARIGRVVYLPPRSIIYTEESPVEHDADYVYAVVYGCVEMHKSIENRKGGSWSRREGSSLMGHILRGRWE